MESLGLWEALELWFSGQTLDGYAIGPVPIILIGRTGAVLSLLGGSVVVLDLAGADRLRKWGDALRSQPLTRLRNWTTDNWVFALATFLGLSAIASLVSEALMGMVSPVLEPLQNFYLYGLPDFVEWIAFLVIVGFPIAGLKAQEKNHRRTAKVLWWCAGILLLLGALPTIFNLIGGFIGYVAGGLILAVALTILGKVLDGLIFLLDPLVVRPIAWAFAHETPGQPIRWMGFVVLLAGQLLELVAA